MSATRNTSRGGSERQGAAKRRVAPALVLAGLVLGGLWVGGQPAEAEVIPAYVELQKFCAKLVRSPEVVLQPFTLDEDKGGLTYYAGDVIVNSDGAGMCHDPLGVLVRTQSRIELARNFVKQALGDGKAYIGGILAPAIDEAESLVAESLEGLRGSKHSHEVRLRGAYVALWRVEGIFLARVRAWADEKGYMMQTLCERQGTCLDPCAPPLKPLARVTTSPPEATIWYIPAFDWDMAALRKVDPRPAMRQAFRSPLEMLSGAYVVKVEWPDGKTWGPERRTISGALVIERPQ